MELNPLYQLVIGVIVMFVTQGVKKVQAIPIEEGQKTRIRTFVVIATFGLTALTAWLDGTLDSVVGPQMVEVGVATGITWLLTHLGYKRFLSK